MVENCGHVWCQWQWHTLTYVLHLHVLFIKALHCILLSIYHTATPLHAQKILFGVIYSRSERRQLNPSLVNSCSLAVWLWTHDIIKYVCLTINVIYMYTCIEGSRLTQIQWVLRAPGSNAGQVVFSGKTSHRNPYTQTHYSHIASHHGEFWTVSTPCWIRDGKPTLFNFITRQYIKSCCCIRRE